MAETILKILISRRPGILALTVILSVLACHRKTVQNNPGIWNKVHVNFKQLDKEGLRGPTGGKVAVNYEYCIPSNEKYWQKVQQIDKTAQKYAGSRGRIGCQQDQWLLIGTTHQPGYQRVLYELASLPFIDRIDETFWE